MRKLKLETLNVESFQTSAGATRAGGTVQAHAAPTYTCDTYDLGCGGASGLDCTYTCTKMNSCPNFCW